MLQCTYFHMKRWHFYLYWRRLILLPFAKRSNFVHLITCFRHYDILAKTRSRITTAITFSRQTTLVHSRAQLSIGKNL